MLDTDGFSIFNGSVTNNMTIMKNEIFYSNIKSTKVSFLWLVNFIPTYEPHLPNFLYQPQSVGNILSACNYAQIY